MMELIKQYLDITVFSILGAMSVVALALVIDRSLAYRRVQLLCFSSQESLRLELQKGLAIVATTASNAPYVGLLGTVFGIMITFHDIGQSGQVEVATVMVGLALALKATALGLLVAIPSMVFYNLLLSRMEALLLQWTIAHEVHGIHSVRDAHDRQLSASVAEFPEHQASGSHHASKSVRT